MVTFHQNRIIECLRSDLDSQPIAPLHYSASDPGAARTMITETFKEFTFEAAHKIPPHSELHGHSFKVMIYLQGELDPVFGWSHNLYEVEAAIEQVKGKLDHKYLNVIDGLEVPSLENVARWIFQELDTRLIGMQRVMVSRGFEGNVEGCTCTRGHSMQVKDQAAKSAAARVLIPQP